MPSINKDFTSKINPREAKYRLKQANLMHSIEPIVKTHNILNDL